MVGLMHPRVLPLLTQLVAESASLLRNVLLARLLGAEEMGLALWLALAMRMAQMVGDLGLDQYLVRRSARGIAQGLACAHFVRFTSGLVLALLLLFIGPWALPGVDDQWVHLIALALLANGMHHLEYRRRQRHGDFRPAFWVDAFSVAVAVLALFPTAHLGHGAIAVSLCLQSLVALGLSHALAASVWRVAVPPAELSSVLRFGLPLMLNALALFAAMQGDRLIVAVFFEPATFAVFAVAAQCALLPVLVATRYINAVGLAELARKHARGEALWPALHRAICGVCAIAALYAIAFWLLAPFVIGALFGSGFVPGSMLAGLFGVAAALRLARSVASVAFAALGHTRTIFWVGMPRSLTVALALFLLLDGSVPHALEWIVVLGTGGEAASLLLGWVLLRGRTRAVIDSPRRHVFQDVVDRHLCMGCGNCAAALPGEIAMVDTVDQGRRPIAVGEAPRRDRAEQRRLLDLCPGRMAEARSPVSSSTPFGTVLEVWEGHATDTAVRHAGSSGGVVTALARNLLDRGAVDGVVQVRARPDAPMLNETVISALGADVEACAASRYAPASPCDALPVLAERARPHAFIGKPCDVAGARALAAARPEIGEQLALTIAIFCAGTPSLAGTRALARSLGAPNPESVRSVRYRGNGWPGDMVVEWTDEAGAARSASTSYAVGWGEILTHYKQWRCQLCADHVGETADLSVGDPWYREPRAGEAGDSLILVRTEAGRQALRAAMAMGAVRAVRRDASVIAASQPNLVRTRGSVFGRRIASGLLGLGVPEGRWWPLAHAWLHALDGRGRVSSLAGTVRRILRQQRLRRERFIPLVEVES